MNAWTFNSGMPTQRGDALPMQVSMEQKQLDNRQMDRQTSMSR